MSWWVWIVIGGILLGSELAFVDAQFYLVFLGIAALLVGAVDLAWPSSPVWLQWLIFAALSIGSMVAFRRKLYVMLRGHVPDMKNGPVGDYVVVSDDLAPGATCRVEYRGTTWDARNDGEHAIAAGTQAKIARVEGLTLRIKS